VTFKSRRNLIALVAAVGALALLPAAAQAKFQLGLQDTTLDGTLSTAVSEPGYQALSRTSGNVVRVNVAWYVVAGGGPTMAAGFDLSNPSDPHYNWAAVDNAVRRATAHHLQVMLMLFRAPRWAQGPGAPSPTSSAGLNLGPGAWKPNPTMYRQFVSAVAQRYSGTFPDPKNPGANLPDVKDYEIWNEENLWRYVAGPNTVGQFRNLLSAGYNAVKGVDRSDQVVLGGLAPISPQGIYSTHPLTFAEQLFCVKPKGNHYVRTCKEKVRFDEFAAHPYTLAGTPTKPAFNRNDLLIADAWKLRGLLRAAEKLHTINSGPHPLWNTEWAWFTNPPNATYGDSPHTAARYVAYSMYLMWKAGFSMVIWQTLADTGVVANGSANGGGLETQANVPKPQMTAFGFPLIASVTRKGGYAWGRAPMRRKVTVFVQHLVKGKWKRVAKTKTDGWGVFQVRFKAGGNGTYRAQAAGGATSLPYFSAKIPAKRTHAFNFG
jgi:hypothetical protein